MSVIAFIGNPNEAESVAAWAGRFAAARQTELIILYVPEVLVETELLLDDQLDAAADPTRTAILDSLQHIDNKPGVEILFAGRAGTNRISDPVDFGIILSSSQPLSRSEGQELIRLVRETMQQPELRIKVGCVVEGWANKPGQEGIVREAD